jgi:hypothetical protein
MAAGTGARNRKVSEKDSEGSRATKWSSNKQD